jgi:predicted Zn-dependent protease
LKINPDNLGAKYVKVQCQPDEIAKEEARELMMKYPDYYRIYVFLGNILDEQSDRIELYEKSLFYDPNYIITHIQMAILIAKRQEDKARNIIADLIAKNPKSHKVYWGLGQVEMERNNISEAI